MENHILVPMDASECAMKALTYALETNQDARVTVLHVTNPLEDTYFASEEEFYTEVEVMEQQADARAEDIFQKAKDLGQELNRDLETRTALGPPAESIVEFTETEGFDQIVMGSRGRSGVARLLLGSVAETVVRRAPVPVTVVK